MNLLAQHDDARYVGQPLGDLGADLLHTPRTLADELLILPPVLELMCQILVRPRPGGGAARSAARGDDDLTRPAAKPWCCCCGPGYGEEMISIIARARCGLPAHVVPFAVREVTQIGLDFLLTSLASANPGAGRPRACRRSRHDPAASRCGGRNFSPAWATRAGASSSMWPPTCGPRRTPVHNAAAGACPFYRATEQIGGKRMILWAPSTTAAQAPTPVEFLAMPGTPFPSAARPGAPPLCLSCVSACRLRPRALARRSGPAAADVPGERLRAVRALPQYLPGERDHSFAPPQLRGPAKNRVVLKEEEPFRCIRCGKPFASPSVIDRLTTRLVEPRNVCLARPAGSDQDVPGLPGHGAI